MTMSTTIVPKTLKYLLKTKRMTCKEAGKLAGVSESAVIRYKNGERNIPEDVIVNLSKNAGLDELKMAYKAEKKLGIINIPIMNNIDDSLQCMIVRIAKEEIPEAVKAMWDISNLIMNKKELTKNEIEDLYKCMEEIADLIPGIETFLVRLKQVFGVSLDKLDMTLCQKFKQKHYVVDIDIKKGCL